MVRDGTFCPDASQSNYFPGMPSRPGGTPSHVNVVMQPFTPAFLERRQPGTPGVASWLNRDGVEIKTEDGWSVESRSSAQVIEIS